MFVECEQAMFSVVADVTDEACEPLDELRVRSVFITRARRAHVDFELETVKRMCPRAHLSIHKRTTRTQPRNMNMMIDQSLRIDIVESTIHQVGRLRAELLHEFLRSSRERTTDGMNQTH
jgi:hypothetical protein